MPEPSNTAPGLSELLLRWQQARLSGTAVSAEELCADCPELLGPLREQIAAVVQTQVPPSADTGLTGATTVAPSSPTPGPAAAAFAFLAPPQNAGELGRLGPFAVRRVLGAGGMGMVFEAHDPALKRAVALKVMKPELAADAAARQRFLREAQAMAAVEHEHVVPVYQIGEDRGVPFLAMPLLQGESLHVRLKRDRPLPVAEVLRIGREVAEGLAAAHARGLIHRDIKPGNLWLEGAKGRVKVLDFGLARAAATAAASADPALTQAGAMVGTPAYMSPEQADGGRVEAASDLFSLGSVLYELSTGVRPFQGAETLAVLKALAVDDPVPPRERNPQLPQALAALIERLLAKPPGERPASAAEVAEALQRIEQDMGRTTPVPVEPVPSTARLPHAAPGRPRRVRRFAWVGAGVLVLVVAAVGGYLLVPPRRADAPAAPVPPAVVAAAKPPPSPPLQGYLDVMVLRGKAGDVRLLRLSHPEALPLREGADHLRIEARLNRPAYLYLVWVDTEGKAELVYPWDEDRQCRPPGEKPVQELFWPSAQSGGLLTDGPAGTSSLLLLARDEKLPAATDVGALFGPLPMQKSFARREAAWFENGLVVQGENSWAPINFGDRGRLAARDQMEINDPVLRVQALLRTTLKQHFTYSRAVCFSCEPAR